MSLVVARSRAELADLLGRLERPRAAVLTMGALHEGHRALLDAARGAAASVIVTIFVNPLQFAPGEDFERYPRRPDEDMELCRQAGVDLVFAPSVDELYPGGPPLVTVAAGRMASEWEGAFRPGHFDGVLTVVLKLFHLTSPDVSFFGEKDAQQIALIRRMVTDLDLPVRIESLPTVRAADGLAVSSRNAYLSPAERAAASALPRALHEGCRAASLGVEAVVSAAREILAKEAGLSVDYLAVVDDRFTEVSGPLTGPARLIAAVRVGGTRLIDNVPLVPGQRG